VANVIKIYDPRGVLIEIFLRRIPVVVIKMFTGIKYDSSGIPGANVIKHFLSVIYGFS